MADSAPVVIASDQASFPVTIAAGSAVIGHVITDSGSVAAVTGTVTANAGTNLNTSLLALESGGNLASVATNTTNIPNVIGTAASAIPSKLLQIGGSDGTNARAIKTNTSGQMDIRPLTSSDNVTIANSTLAVTQSGNWSVRNQDGAGNALTTNSTTYTAKFALDTNLLGTLGTAFSTAGKVDVKGADGDVFVRQATASNLNATVVGTGTFAVQATLSAETTKVIGTVRNLGNAGAVFDGVNTAATAPANGILGLGLYNSTEPSPTTGQSVGIQLDSKGRQRMVLMDAAGNTRGLNIDSNNNAGVVLQTQTDTVMVGGVNIKEINAVTPLMGNGATGTGSQRVTIANDNTGIANWGQGATGSAVPSGAEYQGLIAKTANPSAATDGNMVGAMGDKIGRQVSVIGQVRQLITTQTTTITASTSETTVFTAVASTFLDLTAIAVANTSATATRVDFRDTTAGSVLFSIYVPAGDTRGIVFTRPFPQTTVNTNWTAQSSASVTDLRIFMQAEKNI